MPQFEQLFAKFAALPNDKRRELDDALSFMETARMPTEQGAKNRGMLAQNRPDPANVRLLGAYAAYRYKISHQPMDERKRQIAQLQGVPADVIAKQDSVETWEEGQFNRFAPVLALLDDAPKNKADIEMQPEQITAAAKPKKAKPKPPAPKPEGGAPSMMPPPNAAAPVPIVAPPPPAGVPTQQLAAPPADGFVDPALEQERARLLAMHGGQIA